MKIKITQSISIPVSKDVALGFIRRVETLPQYEPKVRGVVVKPKSFSRGNYLAFGSLAGLKWFGEFTYHLTERGFYSRIISGAGGVTVFGRFIVSESLSRQVEVMHTELYFLPWWTIVFFPILKLYLLLLVRKELKQVRACIMSVKPNISSLPTLARKKVAYLQWLSPKAISS